MEERGLYSQPGLQVPGTALAGIGGPGPWAPMLTEAEAIRQEGWKWHFKQADVATLGLALLPGNRTRQSAEDTVLAGPGGRASLSPWGQPEAHRTQTFGPSRTQGVGLGALWFGCE